MPLHRCYEEIVYKWTSFLYDYVVFVDFLINCFSSFSKLVLPNPDRMFQFVLLLP